MKALGHGANVAEMAAQYGKCIDEVIDFSSNINPFVSERIEDILPSLLEAAKNYPDIHYTALRGEIATYTSCEKGQIIVGNGATEIIYLLMKSLCHLKEIKVLGVVNPTFSEYERSARLNGIEIIDLYLKSDNNFALDEGSIEKKLPQIDALFICNPNNPTGRVFDLKRLVDIIKAQDKWLIVDETFMEFVEEESTYSLVPLIKSYSKLIVIKAITKFFGLPGLRLGYGITSHKGLLETMYYYKEPWTVNSFAEHLTGPLLRDEAYQRKSRAYFKKERGRMLEVLNALGGVTVYPTSANFILLRLERITAKALKEKLFQEENILIRDASNFKGLNVYYIRVAIKTPHENQRLVAALKKCLSES